MKITLAFIKKELLQILRDPSSLIIAFILPFILLLIYTYGLNMDAVHVRLGIHNADQTPQTIQLIDSLNKNKYIDVFHYWDKNEMYADMRRGKISGALLIPSDFMQRVTTKTEASLLLITDGAELNQVSYAQSYVSAVVQAWQATLNRQTPQQPSIQVEVRVWYNQSLNGVWSLVPASLAVTMTLIGILLTALVIAREWERGTMESLLTTNIRPIHFVIGKYVPYFLVGMGSLIFNLVLMIFVLGIPFRGSWFLLFFISALFLYACLGIGLIISGLLKNQFLASIASLLVGFLPAFMLSGLIFPIESMPKAFQYLTLILPPRYYISFIRSAFLSKSDLSTVFTTAFYLFLLGFLFSVLVYRKTPQRIED